MKRELITYIILLAILASPSRVWGELSEDANGIIMRPDYGQFFDAEYFYLDIMIEPAGVPVNAAMVDITYQTANLEYVSVEYDENFCFMVVPAAIDTENGSITFACGTDSHEFTANTNIMRIKFNKLSSGTTKIILNGSQLLLADGSGTLAGDNQEILFTEIIK